MDRYAQHYLLDTRLVGRGPTKSEFFNVSHDISTWDFFYSPLRGVGYLNKLVEDPSFPPEYETRRGLISPIHNRMRGTNLFRVPDEACILIIIRCPWRHLAGEDVIGNLVSVGPERLDNGQNLRPCNSMEDAVTCGMEVEDHLRVTGYWSGFPW